MYGCREKDMDKQGEVVKLTQTTVDPRGCVLCIVVYYLDVYNLRHATLEKAIIHSLKNNLNVNLWILIGLFFLSFHVHLFYGIAFKLMIYDPTQVQ